MGLLKLGLKTLTDPSLIIAPKHCHSERRPIRRDRPKSKNPWFLPLSRSFNLAITAGRPSSGEAPLPPLSPPVLASLFASDRGVLRLSVSRPLFAGVIFLGAFLLFLVEPMAAKELLPSLGGSAAVWITCLVFFQTALLLAYLYAHWLTRHPHWQLHLIFLVAALVLAAFWAAGSLDLSSGAQHPVTTIFYALGIWIGLPFLALGATSPLLQVWWSQIERSAIPYRLFALSNLGSLLALAAYPTLIEPNFTLRTQRIAWCCGFALFALLAATLTLRTREISRPALSPEPADSNLLSAETGPSPLVHKLLWLLLPMGASMQLSAVTSYITANIAPIPLLWILPLGVYLLTIILAFEFPRLLPRGILVRLLAVLLGGLAYMLAKVDHSLPIGIGVGFFLVELLIAGLFLHVEAYRLRPQRTSASTVFYLLFAAGGALGSFLIGIAAPLLFDFNYDLAITFFITALLALAATWRSGWPQRLLWSAASIMLLVLTIWIHIAYQRQTLVAVRNFYGSLRVKQNYGFPGATLRTLANGTIEHGTQIFGTDAQSKTPTTYYALDSGVGLALRFCCPGPNGSDPIGSSSTPRPRNIGVIGFGAGTLAAYGQSGDRIRFYEINPRSSPSHRMSSPTSASPARRSPLSAAMPNLAYQRIAESVRRARGRCLHWRCDPAPPAHYAGARALSPPPRARRNHRLPHLQPACRSRARPGTACAIVRHESHALSSPANDDRDEFSAYWV